MPRLSADGRINTFIAAYSAGLYMVLLLTPIITTRLVRSFNLSPSEVGTLLFLEIGTFGFASVPAYLWLTRVNWVAAARVFTVLAVVGNAASAFAENYYLLIACRMATALAAGSLTVLILASASRTSNPGRSYGIFLTSQLSMAAILLALLPAVLPVDSITAIYLVLAALALLCLPVSGFIGQRKARVEQSTNGISEESVADKRRRGVLAAAGLAAILLFYISLSSVWSFVTEIAIDSGVSTDIASYGLSAATVSGILAAVATTFLGEHRHKLFLILGGYLGLIGSMLILFGTVGVVQFFISVVLFKFTYTFVLPYLLSIVATVDRTGNMMSSANIMVAGGFSVGPLIGGILIDFSGGYATMLMFAVAVMAVSVVCGMWAQVRSSRYRAELVCAEESAAVLAQT